MLWLQTLVLVSFVGSTQLYLFQRSLEARLQILAQRIKLT
jgi:hypothetical protein